MKLISFIIPVYNSEKYLNRCLDSLISQGLSDETYEIILVNDGSKDNSFTICKDYQSHYGNNLIKILNQSNQGVSSARNNGLKIASGKYVNFIDSDDYLIPNGLAYLINKFLDDTIDILTYWALTIDNKLRKSFIEDYKVTGNICFEKKGIDFLKHNFQTFIVTSLFKRSFLEEHKLLFVENLCIGEDVLFSLQTYLKDPQVRMVSSRIYRYDLHQDSAIHKRDYNFVRKTLDSYVSLFCFIIERINENKDSNVELTHGLRNILENQFVPFISRFLSSNLSFRESQEFKQKFITKGILPLTNKSSSSFLINLIFKTLFGIKVYQCVYQKLFLPYIFPRLSRN